MALTKVLIVAKTYPTISVKYDELVCTAGFKEDGTWIRIYPIQFRKKTYEQQYSKYDWVEIDLVKNEKDFRPESFRPYSENSEIKKVGQIASDGGAWNERRKFVLSNFYTNLTDLIEDAKNKEKYISLAVFKPNKIIDFKVEEVEREWDKDKLEALNQLGLFESVKDGKFEVVKKLPYKFSYFFKDEKGKESTLMIEDWEIGQLYWKCLAKHEGNETLACEDIRKKYFDNFTKRKDIYFFMGTSLKHHAAGAKNPFMIISIFYPNFISQIPLF